MSNLIAKNPVAHYNFFIEDTVEAGIVLSGTEIKSVRARQSQSQRQLCSNSKW